MRVKIRLIIVIGALITMVIYRSCRSTISTVLKATLSVTEVTEQTFEKEVLKAQKPVVAKFFASWCGPCRRMEPIDTKMADEFSDVSIVKIDVDTNAQLVSTWGIEKYPTYLFFKNGTKQFEQVGSMDEATYRKYIKMLI